MISISKLLIGAAAIGVTAIPAAASAQYYPQQSYPNPYQTQSYPQQGYPQQGGIMGVINQLLGGGNRYNNTDRMAVSQCAAAAQAQASAQYRPRGYNQYQGAPYGNAYGYNQGPQAQVTGITGVERRRNGLRVTGLMNSGMVYAYPNQGYAPSYNPAYANTQSDLSFRCTVDYRGAVTNIRVNRNDAYRR